MTPYEYGFLTKCASSGVPKEVAFRLLKIASKPRPGYDLAGHKVDPNAPPLPPPTPDWPKPWLVPDDYEEPAKTQKPATQQPKVPAGGNAQQKATPGSGTTGANVSTHRDGGTYEGSVRTADLNGNPMVLTEEERRIVETARRVRGMTRDL